MKPTYEGERKVATVHRTIGVDVASCLGPLRPQARSRNDLLCIG